MSETPAERVGRALLRSSHRACDLRGFRIAADAALRPGVGWDVAAWSTTDPATLLFTGCVLIGMPEDHAVEQRLFDLEFRTEDVNQFRDLARARVPVARLHDATGGDLSRSERWRTLLAQLGVTDELRAVFRDREDCWGTLVAYRFGGPPFTAADVDLVAGVAPLVADGLRRCMLRDAVSVPPGLPAPRDAPGMLIADADGVVTDTTAQAERWLARIADPGTVPSSVRSVAAAARAAASGRADLPARARLPCRDGGWLLLHGSALAPVDGTGAVDRVAIVVEPARQTHLADVMVRAYGLTGREREITELVLQGCSTTRIAERLFISAYTVQDHLKSILAKTGVSSRRDLVAELFGRHYAPATRSGALPSPYGWYAPGPA
ncbi:helix-turn-helix domain-containing protein [Kitasatospora sp. NPDC004240]